MSRPLVSVVIAYAAGLLLAEFFPAPPTALFGAGFGLLAGALVFGKLRPLLLWPLLLVTGWTNLAVHTQILSPRDLRVLLSDQPQIVTVRGILCETPGERIYVRDGVEKKRTLAQLQVRAIAEKQDWQAAAGSIVVSLPGTLPEIFFKGQPVEIDGVIAPPPIPVAEGLFNYREYLKRKGIYFELKTDSPADWTLRSTNTTPPLSDRFRNWARTTLSRGLPEVDEPIKLLWAMTLGWRTALTDDVSVPFRETGTIHIFAISGLHIALIAGILLAILRAAQLPRFFSGAIIIPLLWFYTMATGWQPSAIRSTIMMSIVIGGWMLKRPGNLLNSLAGAAWIILIFDPRQLFQASFQLSFFVVLSMALFLPPLEKWRDRLLQTDPLLPYELVPRWRRWLTGALRGVLTWFAVSFAAWLGSWPWCAYYFHLFSPITLLANVCIVPLASVALASSLGSLICGAWLPWFTELFNHGAWFWMTLVLKISRSIVQWPHAFFYVSGPTIVDFVIYYGMLLAVLTGALFKRAGRIPAAVCLAILAGFYGWRWHAARQHTTLTVLPVNGGSAVFVRTGNAADTLLVNCGDSNAVAFITAPFLHAQGINHLPQLALTQGRLREMGGALAMCDAFSMDRVFISSVKFRSHVYRETVAQLKRRGEPVQIVNRGDAIARWQVLYPAATGHFARADDDSLVLKGDLHGLKILMLSNLGRDGQAALLNQTNDLRADVVVAGLPTQSEPLDNALLARIQPEAIVVADSEFPATRRAPAGLRDRLAAQKIPVIYTRNSGAVTIVAQPDSWTLRTMDGQKMSGAQTVEGSMPHQLVEHFRAVLPKNDRHAHQRAAGQDTRGNGIQEFPGPGR
jgi:ComEC/Rec2-related protein